MSTDRELMELAAKAAGLSIDYWADPKHPVVVDGEGRKFGWAPLSFDSDALRLIVRLGLCVKVDNRAGFSWVKKSTGSSVPHNGDPYAATRRAVLLAAAAIGATLEPKP
jgi:hypothetical protein